MNLTNSPTPDAHSIHTKAVDYSTIQMDASSCQFLIICQTAPTFGFRKNHFYPSQMASLAISSFTSCLILSFPLFCSPQIGKHLTVQRGGYSIWLTVNVRSLRSVFRSVLTVSFTEETTVHPHAHFRVAELVWGTHAPYSIHTSLEQTMNTLYERLVSKKRT